MNRLWRYIRGYCRVKVTGADPSQVLNTLASNKIPFWNIYWSDEFTVLISIFPRDYRSVESISVKLLCQIQLSKHFILKELFHTIICRTCLWIFLILSLFIMLFLQRYVLFFDVEGNTSISDQEILRSLEALDVQFGCYGPNIKSQWVEDHLLNMIRELQWITVNQSGVKATVHVREQEASPVVMDRKGFSNVVASRAAIITNQSVWSGQALKESGDIVYEGELLVSGIVDLEKTYLITRAQAEIYGRTWRNMAAVTPQNTLQKTKIAKRSTSIWVEIGKTRIKILGNSGISTATYDKMINRKILSLPGGYTIPVSICVETYLGRELLPSILDKMWAELILSEAIYIEVDATMIAGEILQKREYLSLDCGLLRLNSFIECNEMISKSVEANLIEEDYLYG